MAAEVADAARRLCELRLAEGEPEAAIAAVRAALLLAPPTTRVSGATCCAPPTPPATWSGCGPSSRG
ncbi:hypothetical protein ACFSTC_49840 [Nonomuraea ferruginea]